MGRGTIYPFIENILKAQAKPDFTVLEIGAGGAVYKDLFNDYYGTDLASTLYAGKGDIAAYCDGQVLPFKDGAFDLMFTVATLYQIPDTKKVMKEAYRTLGKGGMFIIFDYNKKQTRYLKEKENDGDNHDHVWSPRELKMIAEENGFQAHIINHWKYFPSSGNRFKVGLFRNGVVFAVRNKLFKDWNVILARK